MFLSCLNLAVWLLFYVSNVESDVGSHLVQTFELTHIMLEPLVSPACDLCFLIENHTVLLLYQQYVNANRKYLSPETRVLQKSSEVFTSWPSSQKCKVLLLLTLPSLLAMGRQIAVNARLSVFSCPFTQNKSLISRVIPCVSCLMSNHYF